MWRPFLPNLEEWSWVCEHGRGRGGDVRFFGLFDAFLDLLDDPYDTNDSSNEDTRKLSFSVSRSLPMEDTLTRIRDTKSKLWTDHNKYNMYLIVIPKLLTILPCQYGIESFLGWSISILWELVDERRLQWKRGLRVDGGYMFPWGSAAVSQAVQLYICSPRLDSYRDPYQRQPCLTPTHKKNTSQSQRSAVLVYWPTPFTISW